MSHNQPGPYGPPPQAFGRPPPYGGVTPGAQPRARMRNTVLAIALTVVVGAVGATGYVLGRGTSHPAAAAPVPYKLTTPPSIVGGAWVGDPNVRIRITNDDIKGYVADGIRNPQPVAIHYKSGSSASGQMVQLSGAWGTIDDPEQAIDRAFALHARKATADKTSISTFLGVPQNVSPGGLGDAVMKCQMYKTAEASHPSSTGSTDPICIWADHSTLGEVMVLDPTTMTTGRTGVTIGEDADTAAKVRADTRVPVR
ncbi:hypothetical protein [Streptomyces sp. CBMA152]|uniref:hypothetical protein n=1 Tax=Streptomyces sp. CBMA152 TaxID=1896312 RepID=UPI00166062C4|nr:hypothetical protein [Streptomyces sp. CBMA152]